MSYSSRIPPRCELIANCFENMIRRQHDDTDFALNFSSPQTCVHFHLSQHLMSPQPTLTRITKQVLLGHSLESSRPADRSSYNLWLSPTTRSLSLSWDVHCMMAVVHPPKDKSAHITESAVVKFTLGSSTVASTCKSLVAHLSSRLWNGTVC